jgi:Rap1a immunity proteins
LKRLGYLLPIILVIGIPGPAKSRDVSSVVVFLTGNDLLDLCRRNRLECVGYVMGATDVLSQQPVFQWQQSETPMTVSVCIPEHVSGDQVTDVVLRELNSHPERRHLSAWNLVAVALYAAFPCP